jgi:recA bacterial DNA recombination protein
MSFRPGAAAVKLQVEAALAHKIPSALTPTARPEPELIPTGIAQLDAALGGIARGCVTEVCGTSSSGRTSVMHSLLARLTRREEAVALVDASDAFHPESAAQAGVELKRLLWVRCCEQTAESRQQKAFPLTTNSQRPTTKRLARVEQALKATDLLLQSGGFGLIVVDLGDIRPEDARRVPLTTWFRFRRAIENTPTALVILEQEPYAKTCASLVLELKAIRREFSVLANDPQPATNDFHCARPLPPTHAHLLHGMQIEVEISRGQLFGKKPPASVPAFETSTELSAIQ